MEILKYPFDSQLIIRNAKKIRRELLSDGTERLRKKIAILGGSTTDLIRSMLELFLLDAGIEPVFYQSGYGQYWQDVMFENPQLSEFQPDIIFIHTTSRNISTFPEITDDPETVERKQESVFVSFRQMWDKIEATYKCPVIQNNFERPYFRLMGNRDISDIHGRANFVMRLNEKMNEYAQTHNNFFINDIDFLSASYGLRQWCDPMAWYMYKTVPGMPAVPEFAYNLANIIKSVYGKNKKVLVLDLDNTLWGGSVGEDGADEIEIGQETADGQMYSEFQAYIKEQKAFGTLLAIDSKNNLENAIAGLSRPDSVLKPEDFSVIKANWDSKDQNLYKIAAELNLGTDAFVFIDDNPAERYIIHSRLPEVSVPEINNPQDALVILDRSGFFEMTNLSEDDLQRNEMYKANRERSRQQAEFTDYKDYLLSLEMIAEIRPFNSLYFSRIAQLTNKSNQFNLTTLRCSEADIAQIAENPSNITLYGRLRDRFGDNGLVALTFGHKENEIFHIDQWLMSCRVLKRNLEFAMMDELVNRCSDHGIKILRGYYYPTKKNSIVRDFYKEQGFEKISEDDNGNTIWEMDISAGYKNKNETIRIIHGDKL